MENIISQIRNILDEPLQKEMFEFDTRSNSYISPPNVNIDINHSYVFDLRKRIGGDYWLLSISLQIHHKQISAISNSIRMQVLDNRDSVPASLRNSLIKDYKKGNTISGIFNWNDIDPIFAESYHLWSCSLYNIFDIANYGTQLRKLFEKGQEWSKQCANWDFLIDWNLNHSRALDALSILIHTNQVHLFGRLKQIAIEKYMKIGYPVDELVAIEYP